MREKLILHTCCAPCFSQSFMVLNGLDSYEKVLDEKPDFDILVFFDNPNIFSKEEYLRRKNELIKLLDIFYKEYKINSELLPDDYETRRKDWKVLTEKYANEPEKGLRCILCYEYRLIETFRLAKKYNIKNVATTLTLSPLKNTSKINEIGDNLGKEYNINYLKSDFKKNDGFKKSIEISKKYNIYRQSFCGCEWSIRKRD